MDKDKVASAFQNLLGWEIWSTETERSAWESHRESLSNRLAASFEVKNFFRAGSTGNGTNVRGYSDSDYFASIPTAHQRANSDTMLSVLRNDLKLRYPSTEIWVRSPVVVVNFGSTAAERYEIAPAYYVERRDGNNVYKIPAGGGEWMKSAPGLHNGYVNDTNDKLYKELKPLIRFIKAIAYWNNIPVSSFYLELRLAKLLSNDSSIVYSLDIPAALKQLIDVDLAAMQDPMGVSGYIYSCTPGEKQDALSKLQTAYNRASKARSAETSAKLADAFSWRDKLFAGKFPAYR